MSVSDEIGYYLSIHHPQTPHYRMPRFQGPVWAMVSAALGFTTMLILEDSRERPEMIDTVRALADEYGGKVRHCSFYTRVEFSNGGELLIRGPQGRNITRRYDQIFTLEREPEKVRR